MNETLILQRRKAFEIQRGNAVIHVEDGDALVCLKAEREGKEYVHHYLVVLDPAPEAGHGMIYIDPDDEVVDCGYVFAYEMTEGEMRGATAAERADVGDVFQNAAGLFLKVTEDPKSQKMFAFVNIHSGEVMRRQERGVTKVFQEWRTTGLSTGEKSGGKDAGEQKSDGITIDILRRFYSETA